MRLWPSGEAALGVGNDGAHCAAALGIDADNETACSAAVWCGTVSSECTILFPSAGVFADTFVVFDDDGNEAAVADVTDDSDCEAAFGIGVFNEASFGNVADDDDSGAVFAARARSSFFRSSAAEIFAVSAVGVSSTAGILAAVGIPGGLV
jgi:hypothetical protein